MGGRAEVANGFAKNTHSPVKNVQKPSSTAVAYGAISLTLRLERNSTRLDHNDSSRIQSSSDPCWVAQTAATL